VRRWIPVLVAGTLLSSAALAQVALVQVKTCGPGGFPATVCTIPATKSGNLIVVGWVSSWGSAPSITSITDNGGNVYAQAGDARSTYGSLLMSDLWYAKNSKPGATAITIRPNVTDNAGAAVIWEFSGIDTISPLGATATLDDQPAATTAAAAAVTTSSPNELVISVLGPVGNILGLAAGSPFTRDMLFYGNGWAHHVAPTPGRYGPVWSIAGGEHHSSTVSFRAAAVVLSPCDINSDGTTNVLDVQLVANMLPGGTAACTVNITGAGVCTPTTVQRIVSAALGGACVVDDAPDDTMPPTVSIVSPGAAATVSGTITVTASASDDTGLAGVQFRVDGANLGAEVAGPGPNYSISLNTATLSNGQHTLSATARDTSGNTGNSLGVMVTVSNIAAGPPAVTLSWGASPTAGVSYSVYRSSTSGGPYTKINSSTISGLSYVDRTVVAGRTYYYVARAVSALGTESTNSNQTAVAIPAS